MGSVREGRRNPQIADWVLSIARASDQGSFERIDLRDWPLPADEEPGIPARGVYTSENTCAWSAKIARADGFVIVPPQYNWGYPAALKNALDHLYTEWNGTPVMIVTYGGHGGGKCAEQLRQVAGGLKMQPTDTMPAIEIAGEAIAKNTPQTGEDLQPFEASLQQALRELAALLAAV
jgi:NAD(P)H-dependent FMN reductase